MAVTDLWVGADKQPTARHGRGRRWRVRVAGHPSRAFATKFEAQAWERELLRRGTPRQGPRVTVGQLLDVWLDGKQGLSEGGLEQCVDAAKRARARWGDLQPSEVARADVQAWIAGMTVEVRRRGEDGVVAWVSRPASHTIRSKALQALGGALRIAVEEGTAQRDATDGVRIPKAARRLPRVLTLHELRALAEACEMPDAIWLLGTTGVRISEAARLKVGDVDAKRGRLVVHEAKSREAREVPIPAWTIAVLDLKRPKSAPLLVHPRGVQTDRKSFRQHILLPAAKRAGIVGLTTHHLRHTAVSQAIRAGADVKMVQKMAGHASATLTLDIYGHLWDDSLDLVAVRMDEGLRAELT